MTALGRNRSGKFDRFQTKPGLRYGQSSQVGPDRYPLTASQMDPDWLGGGGALEGRGPRMGKGVAQLEALQAITTLCVLADHVQYPSLRPVAACAGLPKDESIRSLCVMPFRPTVVCTGLPKHESILQPLCDTLSPNGCLHRAADDVHQNGMRQVASSKCFA